MSDTIASAVPRTQETGGLGWSATRASATSKYLGDIALVTPRVPGPVFGQFGLDVASPG